MSEHATAAVDQIRNRMTRVPVADPATEMIDVDAGLAEEPAVEQTLIDKLVGAAVAGDGAARDRLITEVHPLVLRYCRSRLSRRESVLGSADDVAQEICLAVVAALQSYVVSGRSFRSFVYGIAANKVADAFRAMGRNRTDPTAELPDGPVLHDGPEQRLLDGELAGAAGRAAAAAHAAAAQSAGPADRRGAQRRGDRRGAAHQPGRRSGHPAPRPQSAPRCGLRDQRQGSCRRSSQDGGASPRLRVLTGHDRVATAADSGDLRRHIPRGRPTARVCTGRDDPSR
jgi:RNA polymerase sigma factor (sigma-70 family)